MKEKNLFLLAPLAGYTDLPFRNLAKKFGADITISEMVSANALIRGSEKSLQLLRKNQNESPFGVQIAGSSKEAIKEAVLFLNDIEEIDFIDINAGCPAKKIVKEGSGSALLKDLKNLYEIVNIAKKYSKKRFLSVKMRLGFERNRGIEIAKVCEEAGADMITVHGRLRKDFFKGEVDYDTIAKIKENVSIKVIANGNIASYEKAKEVFNYTKCDGVMIGRGAIGKPWIFLQLKNNKKEISHMKY
jgi:tRNA-dihydrouridine synthase B